MTSLKARFAASRELLRQVESQLGDGHFGPSPMGRLAEQTQWLARACGDHESEALACFYMLYPLVVVLPESTLSQRIDTARHHCQALAVPRALWLLDDLQVFALTMAGKHQQAVHIGTRQLRHPETARPPFERSISLLLLARAHQFSGQQEDALRYSHRALFHANEAPHPRWLAAACTALGQLLCIETLNPEAGLPHLERARHINASLPPCPAALLCASQLVVALEQLDEPARAHAVFTEELARPEAAELLTGPGLVMALARLRLTQALIGVGRLDEAQDWLNALPASDGASSEHRDAVTAVMRLHLLCARGEFTQARQLALAERDRVMPHRRPLHDELALLRLLHAACTGLGDAEGAARAAQAATALCLPLVGRSTRARYLHTQLSQNPLAPAVFSVVDEQRLQAVDQAAQQAAQAPATTPELPVKTTQQPAKVPRFLAHVAHELRTPISGMLGLSTLLLMSDLDDRQRQHTHAMKSTADNLLQLVNDVLDMASLEHGQFSLNPAPFDLPAWLTESLAPYQVHAQLKGLTLDCHVAPGTPTALKADARRLRQVLANLVSNALKFTKVGGVQVRVCAVPAKAISLNVRVEVADTGMGIAPAALPRLFQEFVQADDTIAHQHGGTGLGLALCKQLVSRMGGRIGARSQLGQGSTFWFELPADPAPQA